MKRTLLKALATTITFVVEVVENFFDDHCPQMAAAIAYYAMLSLPPLLIVLLAISSALFDQTVVESAIHSKVQSALSPRATQEVLDMVERAQDWARSGSWWAVAISVVGLGFGATRGFAQMQIALNRAWSIPPRAGNVLRKFLVKRLISFAIIVVMIVLLTLSIAIGAVLERFDAFLVQWLPPFIFQLLDWVSGSALTLLFSTSFLAIVYRVLPDVRVSWIQVLPGAAITALLFEGAKSVIAYYLGTLPLDDAYGQAGSFAVLLIWLYLSGLLLFFGAEFNQVWARRLGKPVLLEDDREAPKKVAPQLASMIRRKWGVPVEPH